MEMSDSPPAEAVVMMDRFVSASSAQDAVNSLEQLVGAFKTSQSGRNDSEMVWQPAWIFDHEEISEHLIWLLQHGTLKANESPCEEGAHLICQLYQYLIKSSDSLMKPRPGVLLESLLDLLDNLEQPVFLRVLALRLLEDVSKGHKSIALDQWLQAPNGLHRIADLLAIDVENQPMDEAIRNQALIVAKSLAREAPMAKIFLFAEVDCKLLDLCWKEGGLTKGSPIVIDALELIQEVLKHADSSLQDLVWQRPNVAPRLIQLLDLRGGEEFLNPKQRNSHSTKLSDSEDDLDSLLASGDGKKKEERDVEDAPAPHLMPSEENVVKLVLNILGLLLEADSVRETVWRQQAGLCSILWELALISNPSNPPVCALPTASLQQEAMNLVADKFNDPIIMDRLSGLDRLLYLVCTGGGISESFEEKLGISQSALAILRQTLAEDRKHDILIRTLAPPPTEDESTSPAGPTVVEKLWNTVQENINADQSEERTLFLSGALGGLGLMLCDQQSREIMYKVTPISLDQISESLSEENESFVKCSLLRFLCEWVNECPFIVHNLLSTTASTNLAGMATTPSEHQSLTHLLLGLSMAYLTKEEECGGWTRNGILQIILKVGISKYTSSLEELKTKATQNMPWIVSDMEYKSWKKFCRQAVLTIRKRVVVELSAGSGDAGEDSDDNENTSSGSNLSSQLSSQGMRPLQKLISQQAKEIEEMSVRLESAEAKVASQSSQLNTWRRRMESNPTQLDHMLNEFTSKNSDLEEKVRSLALDIERQQSEKVKEIKAMEDKLLKLEEENKKLRNDEQEVRDDLERTEQEIKALSQAYTSLEEDFRRQQNNESTDSQSADISQQQQGQSSHEQNGLGSTEVTTLRSENARLKTDAQKADEWMSMAVQKMNEMGTANVELQSQVSRLNQQIEESDRAVDNVHVENQYKEQQRQDLETELKNERALRLSAEEQLEEERKVSQHLEHRIDDAEQALLNYQSVESAMQVEQKRVKELERLLYEAQEASKESTRQLQLEREAINKAFEVDTKGSLSETEETVGDNHSSKAELIKSSQLVDEIRHTSQEELYRLESVIRELKDRLGTGLGGYTVEDILARDEEIEELRKANDSAQEWMGKAVEHDNRKSSQIRKLTEQNASLLEQVEELCKSKPSWSTKDSEPTEEQESEVSGGFNPTKEQFATLKAELGELKREKHANQGLLDELGIAMDDVAVMQQQLTEHKAMKAELEDKLSGNALTEEINDLRSLNEELQNSLNEFEDWVQIAQTKIGELTTEKNDMETRLLDATAQTESLQKENDSLKSAQNEIGDKDCVIEQLREDLEKLTSEINHLRIENTDKDRQYQDLQSQLKKSPESLSSEEHNLEGISTEKNDVASSDPCVEVNEEKVEQQNATVESTDLTTTQAAETVNCDQIIQMDGIAEELQRTKNELVEAKEALASEEKIALEWEERVSQLESELADVQKQMQDQENEAVDAIAKWEQNVTELEEKCAVLEENLRKSSETNESCNNPAEPDSTFSQVKEKDPSIQNALAQESDTVAELREALKAAQDTIAEDEEVVQRWEERTQELEIKIESLEIELRENEMEANQVISKWQSSCAEAESKCLIMENELDHLKATIETQDVSSTEKGEENTKYIEMTQILAQKDEELLRLKEESKSSSISLQKLKDEVLALNQDITSLNEEVENQKAQAINSIEEWTDKVNVSNEEKSKLEIDLAETKSKMAELEEYCSKFDNYDVIASQWEERNRELSESIALLENQLKEQEQEALDAVEQWQSACSDLEIKCADLELSLKENVETRSTNEGNSELEENLRSAKAEISTLLEKEEVEREKWSENLRQMETELATEKERNSAANNEIEMLASSLDQINAESNDALLQWTVRYDELSAALKEAQEQIEEQEIEANEAISVWEMKTDELEKDLDVAEDQLLNLRDLLMADDSIGSEVNVVALVENLLFDNTNANRLLESTRNEVKQSTTRIKDLELESKALSESLSSNEKLIHEMKLKHDDLAHQLALKAEDRLEEERDRLIGVVAQLEEELREANSMLQACVTDGSIDKASEFAANAIRDDVYNMRSQLSDYQQRFEDERAAREVADLEVERLRGDIAALLSLSEHESSPTNVKKLTTKSIEKLQKLEHLEIDELRKSLFRALEELEVARSTERVTNEAVSKLKLQISIYEQEIVGAKSEVNFLSEALEELRQTESSKRASLEYRIGSLENENEVVRKYQANELESLQNELAQMAMEKDLIIHQLKEMEKTNASLIIATSKEDDSPIHQRSDFHAECLKLKIENAHLLTLAADEKRKAERRLREQLSAQVASSELDTILEHELRLEAETALQASQEEVHLLRNDKRSEKSQDMRDDFMDKELEDLRSCLEDVKEQNVKLKAAMNEAASKAKQTIDRLTDECRTAQAKAFKFDRVTRNELAVQSEISKMKILALPGDKVQVNGDSSQTTRDGLFTNNCDVTVLSAEAFDFIRKQQKEIQEERMMYSETLKEHEDLLALVAQQDLEKSCLREALAKVAGDAAANDALKRADEFAISRFGNAVQVSN